MSKQFLTVLDAVVRYGKLLGYDGLVSDCRECACLWDDVAPCASMGEGCQYGMKTECDCGDHDFHVEALAK